MNIVARLQSPHVLLVLAALFFAGNTIAGRLAIDHITPYQLVFLRWLLVVLMIAAVLGRARLLAARQAMRGRVLWLFGMGTAGFTVFNTLFYVAAHHTSAVNLGILQGTMPIWVIALAFAIYRSRTRLVQVLGVLLTVFGVALLSAQGDLRNLSSLSALNIGDLMMLLACFLYAAYAVGLQSRQLLGGLSLFFLLACVALISSVPLLLWEVATTDASWPTERGWLVLLYVAIFPSCLSQIFFIRGVEILGAARAGVFINLVPIFSTGGAVLLLSEPLRWYQLSALAIVLIGITLSEKSGRG